MRNSFLPINLNFSANYQPYGEKFPLVSSAEELDEYKKVLTEKKLNFKKFCLGRRSCKYVGVSTRF